MVSMELQLCCVLTSLLALTAASPHSFSYMRFQPPSSRHLTSFSSARDRIQSSARQNYVHYWQYRPHPVTSHKAAPTFNTNTRTNNVDPGLVSSTRSTSRPVTSSEWNSVVPSKLPSPPGQLASIRWPRFSPGVGDTMLTGQMKDRPSVKWSGASGDLFTIMILDEGIDFLNGQQYVHWLVTNVPADGDILEGTEMMRYVEPFSASPEDPKHPMLVLVYRQPGRVELEEFQRGCSPSIVTSRIFDKDDIAAKYSLELVAGTFFLVTYSGKATDELLCYFSKCNREPFPAAIPGVTDLPSCQPSKEIFDITLRGPKLGRLSEYGAALQNLGVAIKGSKSDGISTGLLTETQAYFGVFQNKRAGDELPAGNLNTTLQGQVNPAFLTYQSRDGASRLFSALGDPTPIFQTFAGDAPLSITFSEPDDQEFDLATFLQAPGEVAFVNLAQVVDRERHLELREKLFAKMANSPYVKDFYKFNVWREEPQGFDNSDTELLIYTTTSREGISNFVQIDLIQNAPEFTNEWWDTFVCTACMSVDRQLGPELQFALQK